MRPDGPRKKRCAFAALVPWRIKIDADLQFRRVKKVGAGGIAQREFLRQRSFHQFNGRGGDAKHGRQFGAQRSIKGAARPPMVGPVAGGIASQMRTQVAVERVFVGEFADPGCGEVFAILVTQGGNDRTKTVAKPLQGASCRQQHSYAGANQGVVAAAELFQHRDLVARRNVAGLELGEQYGQVLALVILFQTFDFLLDPLGVRAVKYREIEIAKYRQHGDVELPGRTRFCPRSDEAPGRKGEDLAKDILFDFTRDVAREAGGLLASIREEKNLSAAVWEDPGFLARGWLGIQLGLHEVGERGFALGRMIHDGRTPAAKRIGVASRATGELESSSAPVECRGRKIDLAKAQRGVRLSAHKAAASHVQPGFDAIGQLIAMRLAVDEQFDFGQGRLMPLAQRAGREVPQEVALRTINIPAQKSGAAFAVGQQLVDARAAAAAFTQMRVQPPKNSVRRIVASLSAGRIGAGEQPRQAAEKHVQTGRQQHPLVARASSVGREGDDSGGRLGRVRRARKEPGFQLMQSKRSAGDGLDQQLKRTESAEAVEEKIRKIVRVGHTAAS